MTEDFDDVPVRLPSGGKAIVRMPRIFTLEDGVHLLNFLSLYITDKTGELVSPAPQQADQKGETDVG